MIQNDEAVVEQEPVVEDNSKSNEPICNIIQAPLNDVQLGRYRHYKGKEYEVIGFAKHSETEEKLVLYIALYDDNQMWARPYDMFMETVEFEGSQVPRFTKIN